ncbi:MAG: hypothetical protein KF744_14505 [Taibaiella sp.]|nr:hypothetical protein [Taibaiella sp.]
MTSCYYNSGGTNMNYSNQWIPAISLAPFSHANTNLLVEARFNNCGYAASCSYTCPPIASGGRWGSFAAGYSAHRWAYSNSSSCAFNPPHGADCPSLEDNPGLGNNVPFTRITITPIVSCTGWTVTPSTQPVIASGGSYSATVSTTVGGCTYYRNTPDSWISLGGTASGGVFYYSVANNVGAARTGHIYITDGVSTVCTLTINQSVSCPTITPSLTHTNVTTCYGNNNGSISVVSTIGGTPPYTYSIDGGGYGSSPNFTGLYAGLHTVSVRDFNGCIGTASRTLTEPSAISFTYTYRNVSCAACDNGRIVITASGGSSYQYSKNGGSTWQSSNTFTGLVSDIYHIQVRQAGCPASAFADVNLAPGAINIPRSYPIKVTPTAHPQKRVLEPIDIGTGSYSYTHTDFNLPAIGTSLNFTRYYNTVNDTLDSQLGVGWSHSYDCYIRNFADTLWIVHYPDGHCATFIPSVNTPGTSFPLFGGTYEKLNKNTSTGLFTLTMKTGEVYLFNSVNKLQSITDANGNSTTIIYTGSNITSVNAPGGRTLSFTYLGSKIKKITDPLGRNIEYNYVGGNLTAVTDANVGVTTFAYDTQHNITQIINARGNTLITNTYDASTGWITGQADALGNTTTISYSGMAPGDATITYPGPGAPHTTVHHDASYRLTQETDELGHNKTYGYDNNNNLTDFTDENGNHTSYTYDTKGNRLTTAKPLGVTTSVSYLPTNRPSSINDPLSHVTSMDYYLGNINVQAIHLPDGSARNYTYYPNGLLKSSSDAYAHITTYNYNSLGDLTSVVSPSGTKFYTYDAVGRRTSEKDENGRIIYYTYNNNDMVIEVKDPYGYTIVDSFDADNNLIYTKDKNGNITRVTYDIKDRVSKITNAVGGNKLFTYDVRDNTKTITDENGNITTFTYDVKNRLVGKSTSLSNVSYGYDNADNLITETNATGASKHYVYDALNRRVSMTDELSHTTNITYTEIGQIKKVTDPLGASTNYTYNPVGLLTGILDAQGNTTSALYDLNGSRTDITDPNGHTQHFTYDASNRLSGYSDAAGNTFSYIYDAAGNLITETKPGGTITRIYDSLNRVRRVVNSGGDTYQYTYDANGNKIAVANATGTSAFVYDSLNHLKKYTDMFGNVVQYTYDAVGNRKSVKYPGGNAVNYNYNADNQMTSVTDWLGHVTNYAYDANSRLASMGYPNGTTCTYGYDIASRLTSKINSMSSGVISKSIFLLDDNGNRTREQRQGPIPFHLTADSFAYTYGLDDRLLSDAHTTYGNDANGNRISAGTTTYNFSIDNVLSSITTPSVTISFSYDGLGNKVKRTQSGNIRRYVLDLSNDLSQVLMEQDNAGVVKATYIYGLGLIARVDSAGNFRYYHFDAQHNTVALTNDSGNVKDTYTYDPFGVMLKHVGNTIQPYTFLGEYGVQQETPSLYFVRARYYDAANGRFIGKDIFPASLLNPQTLNRYVYALDNPINKFDANGLNFFSDAWSAYGNFIDKVGNVAANVDIVLLQTIAGVGGFASTILSLREGPLGILPAGKSANENIKQLEAAWYNLKRLNTTSYNADWRESSTFNGPLDRIYDNPYVSMATQAIDLSQSVNGLLKLRNINSIISDAAMHGKNLPDFAIRALDRGMFIDFAHVLAEGLKTYVDIRKCNY